jgi:hypothetical protein
MKIIDVIHNFDNYRKVLETDPAEKILKRIRLWRDSELAKSDWTQITDSPVDKNAWAQYRQALRDLPKSNNNPREIELPVRPGGN